MIKAVMPFRSRRRVNWLRYLGVDRQHLNSWRTTGLCSILSLGLVGLVFFDSLDNAFLYKKLTSSSVLSRHASALEPRLELSDVNNKISGASRHLLSSNTTNEHHGPAWEGCDYENAHTPGAWIFFHSLCIFIVFVALAIICDDFFVPSLEAISEKLHLSEDVAGATFMAAGSSAPELFTSVAGVAFESDVGVGTIVGSAVFNILIIIALTAALAGQVLHLDWRPLMRDSFFYAMSIACFIGFSWDGYFQHYESAILLFLYCLYITLMFFNPKLMVWLGTWTCCFKTTVKPSDAESGKDNQDGMDGHTNPKANNNLNPHTSDQNSPERKHHQSQLEVPSNTAPHANDLSMVGGHSRRLSLLSQHSQAEENRIFHHHKRGSLVSALIVTPLPKPSTQEMIMPLQEENELGGQDEPEKAPAEHPSNEEEDEEETIQCCPCLPCCPPVRTSPPRMEETEEGSKAWPYFKYILQWVLFIPAFPFVALFSWTIPDCSKAELKKYFMVSFMMSVLWIAALSFAMVTCVSRLGCIIGIETYVMGLVIIAIGTSIPDALSSILVARDGYGDMAVSNAIGSNVFDINLGIGLPFVIRTIIDKGEPISLLTGEQWVHKTTGNMGIIPHSKFGFILLLILFLTITAFSFSGFKLSKGIGFSFVTMYALFLMYAFAQELYCVRHLGIYC